MSFGERWDEVWEKRGRAPKEWQSSSPVAGSTEVKVPLSPFKLLAVFLQYILSACEEEENPGCPLLTSLREDAFTPTFPGVSPKSHHLTQQRQQERKRVMAELQRIKLSLIKALAHRQAQRGWALLQVADSYSQRDPGQILTIDEKVPKYFEVIFSWEKREGKYKHTHQRDSRSWKSQKDHNRLSTGRSNMFWARNLQASASCKCCTWNYDLGC